MSFVAAYILIESIQLRIFYIALGYMYLYNMLTQLREQNAIDCND